MIAALLLSAMGSANPLAGAWALERTDAVMVDGGQVVPNQAVNDAGRATGLILYDPSGWMALQIGAGGRAPDAGGPIGRTRPIATGSYYAYYGRYEVDVAGGVVRHAIKDSLMPPEAGITAVRHFRIDGDRLTLTSDPVDRPGGRRINRIVFHRLSNTTPDTGL